MKAPSHFGVMFEKKNVLRYLSKNSDGKKELMSNFLRFRVAKVTEVGVWG